jgi:hypothetical protein
MKRREERWGEGVTTDALAMIETLSTSLSLCSSGSLPCVHLSLSFSFSCPSIPFSLVPAKRNQVSGVGCRVSCQLNACARVARFRCSAVQVQSRLQCIQSGAKRSRDVPIVETKGSEVSQPRTKLQLEAQRPAPARVRVSSQMAKNVM